MSTVFLYQYWTIYSVFYILSKQSRCFCLHASCLEFYDFAMHKTGITILYAKLTGRWIITYILRTDELNLRYDWVGHYKHHKYTLACVHTSVYDNYTQIQLFSLVTMKCLLSHHYRLYKPWAWDCLHTNIELQQTLLPWLVWYFLWLCSRLWFREWSV